MKRMAMVLVLVLLGLGGPALGGPVRVGLGEALGAVVDDLVGGDHALGEAAQGGAQLEDRAGGVLGTDGPVQKRVFALQHLVPQDGVHLAVVEHAQVVLGDADHA